MSTPYDAALRLGNREIDDMRVSISVQVNQLVAIDQHRDAIDSAVRHEAHVAAADWGSSAYAFIARMRAQRAALLRDRARVDDHLTRLRAQAAEAYGALRAIEGAAGRHRDEVDRLAATAEQSQVDDFSASVFTRTQQAARRARAYRDAS